MCIFQNKQYRNVRLNRNFKRWQKPLKKGIKMVLMKSKITKQVEYFRLCSFGRGVLTNESDKMEDL